MVVTLSLFPKFLANLSVAALASVVREAGLDTTNLVIRDGFCVTRANLAADLPRFMCAVREEGLDVRFATTDYSAQELVQNPSTVALMAEYGIREFRIDYFRCADNPRPAFSEARRQLDALAGICLRHSIRAVYQVHHRMLISSTWSAYELVKDLPSNAVGVELDPGNQSFEGFEGWQKSVRLLGAYLVAAGIKDSRVWRDSGGAAESDKGWRREWCPIDEGVTNWLEFVTACKESNFRGTFVFMPFYSPNDQGALLATLKREVRYLRQLLAQAQEDSHAGTIHNRATG